MLRPDMFGRQHRGGVDDDGIATVRDLDVNPPSCNIAPKLSQPVGYTASRKHCREG